MGRAFCWQVDWEEDSSVSKQPRLTRYTPVNPGCVKGVMRRGGSNNISKGADGEGGGVRGSCIQASNRSRHSRLSEKHPMYWNVADSASAAAT